MGIGDWGLGIGDWGLGIGPNPQSPKIKNNEEKNFYQSFILLILYIIYIYNKIIN